MNSGEQNASQNVNLFSKSFYFDGRLANTQRTRWRESDVEFGRGWDYVEVLDSNSLDLVTAMTIEMWAQVTSLVSSDVDIFLNKKDSYELGIAATNDYMPQQNFAFALSINGSWAGWYDGRQRLEFGQWHHVATTYNGELANAYVDGVLTASYTAVGQIDERDTTLRIGARGTGEYSHSLIDEVRVWDIARTQQEIQLA